MVNMIRTQLYITRKESRELDTLAKRTGKKKSELIRHAIDNFIQVHEKKSRAHIMEKAFGIWRGRNDFDDLNKVRREMDDRI